MKVRLKETTYGAEMRLHLGNELMYSESLLECLDEGRAWTMAGSHYILVEFLPSVRYEELYRGLRRLAIRRLYADTGSHGALPLPV